MSRETNLRYEQPHKPSKLYLEYMKNIKKLLPTFDNDHQLKAGLALNSLKKNGGSRMGSKQKEFATPRRKILGRMSNNYRELEYLDSHNNTQKQTDQKQVFEQWLEESNKKQKAKQLATDKRNVLAELKLVAKANLLVRKRALALRIESDQKQFEAELAQMGKAFHKQRL